jgi:hypothetical protein
MAVPLFVFDTSEIPMISHRYAELAV